MVVMKMWIGRSSSLTTSVNIQLAATCTSLLDKGSRSYTTTTITTVLQTISNYVYLVSSDWRSATIDRGSHMCITCDLMTGQTAVRNRASSGGQV